MSALQIDDLFSHIYANLNFDFSDTHERSFELEPSLVSKEKLKVLSRHKINRLSFGVQSFNKDTLTKINRSVSSVSKVKEIIDQAKELKFSWINVDLISGLADENLDVVKKNITLLADLSPDSIILYSLRKEAEKSVLYKGRNGYYQAIEKIQNDLMKPLRKAGLLLP